MHNFQQRKKMRKMLSSRVVFIVVLAVTILLIRGAFGVYQKQVQSADDLVKVKESLLKAQEREGELAAAIEHLKTPEGVEREIRGKFNVARQGEEVIIIVDDANSSSDPEQKSPSFFEQVKRFFLEQW